MSVLEELRRRLRREGADLVEFCSLDELTEAKRNGYACGISIAAALPPQVAAALPDGPTAIYHQAYLDINRKLEALAESAVEYLSKAGVRAESLGATVVTDDTTLTTPLPHKTLAVLAGLGWIGKCALLVTEAYGSAVRLNSVLCDISIVRENKPMESHCGSCRQCVEHCPGLAPVGENWRPGDDRERIFRAVDCRKAARALAKERLAIELTLCGICIGVCPFTRRYLQRTSVWNP